ncbi:MAG: CbbQ/NirQ/NorQ C-terminal domain-containing protein [Thiotrichaceae bacterium]
MARNLKGHGLDEGEPNGAYWCMQPRLIKRGIAPITACRMSLVNPITDDVDIRPALNHAISAVFA